MEFFEKATRIAASAALTIALVPAVALTAPQVAEAATAVKVEVTHASTGKITLKEKKTYKLGVSATKGAKVKYSSSKKSVVKVSTKGLLSAKKTGKATVTVKAVKSGKSATKKIRVAVVKPSKYKAVKKVSLKISTGSLTIGSATKTSVTFSPSKPSNANVVFKSSDTSVATVSAKGIVTAKGAGYATITATSCSEPNRKATVSVKVIKKQKVETKMSLAEGTVSAGDGASVSSDGSTVSMPESSLPSGFTTGDVLLAKPDDNNPMGTALKASNVNISAGRATVTGIQVENFNEVFDSLEVSAEGIGAKEVYFAPANGVEFNADNQGSSAKAMSLSSGISTDYGGKLSAKDGKISGTFKFKGKDGKSVKVSASIDPSLDLDIKWNGHSFDQFKALISNNLEFKVEGSAKNELSQPLGAFYIPVPSVGMCVTVTLFLNANVEGTFSVTATATDVIAVDILAGKPKVKHAKSNLEFEGGAGGKIGLEPDFMPTLFGMELYDVSFETGGDCTYKATLRPNGMTCEDLNAFLYLDVMSGHHAPSFFKNTLKLEFTWEVSDKGNSPLKKKWHWENGKLVKKCTYSQSSGGNDGGDSSGNMPGSGGSGNSGGEPEDAGAKPNNEKDFDYSIRQGDYGYGAYAKYIGSSKDVVVPKTLGGADVVSLYCASKKLTSLDTSGCTGLKRLWCNNNQLTSLDVSKCIKLENLECEYNQLVSIDVSGCATLKMLWCHTNNLASLDVSKCAALKELHCQHNRLDVLDVSEHAELETLECFSNSLDLLDVSGCTVLKSLVCYSNRLDSLSISECTELETLRCGANRLNSLNVSECTALEKLGCGSNHLTSLDVSKCTALKELDCFNNRLTSLDVSECAALKKLQCDEDVSVIGWPR